jgi:hypothetical protein
MTLCSLAVYEIKNFLYRVSKVVGFKKKNHFPFIMGILDAAQMLETLKGWI